MAKSVRNVVDLESDRLSIYMNPLLLTALVCMGVWFWVKNTRAKRKNWLARLALPGAWVCELSDKTVTRIEFTGSVHEGNYTEYEEDCVLKGGWKLESHTLTLEREAGGLAIDIVLFGDGKLGMNRPDGSQRIYLKVKSGKASNVVELPFKK